MIPSARINASLELLTAIDTVARPADAIVSGYFRARRYIGSKDREAVSRTTYDVLRHYARLSWWMDKIGVENTPRARLIAYLKLVDKKNVKEISELFDGKKFSPETLNEEDRALLKKLEGHTLIHPNMSDAVVVECPDWAEKGLQQYFGKEFANEMQALLQPAPLDLRVNTLKTTRERAIFSLKQNGIEATECRLSPHGIRVLDRPALNRITMLRDGSIEIQDEGSQLVSLLVNAEPGQRVVDFCAGAGGKTLAISAEMKNKGRIIACDVLANRLKRSKERFIRAGLHNIETKPLSTEHDPWVKHHKGEFDRVLVDAPCSGTGTWRRNPDARWRSLGPGLEALLPLQTSILDSAARLVKPGGRLVYATCSMLPEENEKQIEQFLAFHTDFKLIPVSEAGKAFLGKDYTGQYLRLTPAKHETDGFFAAVLERVKA
ncbi:MAG: RsmB/NOP family class I SAM-dependent RNA methyltransferase [Alphaproteobacteria bacterium]|nr:RsmB/NOP family class I SAM-dependent RNA methyltransferase [Alphaproteobacteria bacterium]